MTREESKARNALEKVSNKCRKQVAKKFGWKQSQAIISACVIWSWNRLSFP